MSSSSIRLVLGELEAEVLQEALELYLQARHPKSDRRYEYRYRAAQAVLDTLWQRGSADDQNPNGDDEPVVTTGLWERRNTDRIED